MKVLNAAGRPRPCVNCGARTRRLVFAEDGFGWKYHLCDGCPLPSAQDRLLMDVFDFETKAQLDRYRVFGEED